MSCCSIDGMNRFFSKHSRRYKKQFRKKGLDKPSRRIVEALSRYAVKSQSVLEIGCGVGGLLITLLQKGAASAQGVEVSEGMLAAARELAAELNLTERMILYQGDFATMDGSIVSADIVILDKVLCCYPMPDDLIGKSAMKAADLYAVSYPRDSFLGKTVFKTSAWIGELLRWSFHPYYHVPETLDETICAQGFIEVFADATLIWQIKIFQRRKIAA